MVKIVSALFVVVAAFSRLSGRPVAEKGWSK
jgi:hypothetical protein